MADNAGRLQQAMQTSLGRYGGNWAHKNGHLHGVLVQAMIPGSEFLFASTTISHGLMVLYPGNMGGEIHLELFLV